MGVRGEPTIAAKLDEETVADARQAHAEGAIGSIDSPEIWLIPKDPDERNIRSHMVSRAWSHPDSSLVTNKDLERVHRISREAMALR